jgi:hypothetical protein
MSKPVLSLKKFPVEVAVWENQKDGKTYYSTKLSKRYKDKDKNEWKQTEYLSTDDLLPAAELLSEAWRQIVLQAKDAAPDAARQDGPPDPATIPF